MRIFICAVALTAALTLLADCADKPVMPYDKAGAGRVTTIGVLTPAVPPGPTIHLGYFTVPLSHPDETLVRSTRLSDAMTDAEVEIDCERELGNILAAKRFDARALLLEKVKRALVGRGYKVIDVPVIRESDGTFMKAYPVVPDADAYLDLVVLDYGYFDRVTGGAPYEPLLMTEIRMVDAANASVLMQERVRYAALERSHPKDDIAIASDPKYRFDGLPALMSQPDMAVEGLNAAFTKSAEAMSALLQ
ncbi:hypothetical protein [Parvibaculum sp. MBR-TMA-1.3b-4.2]|jgi:hypothetical protein